MIPAHQESDLAVARILHIVALSVVQAFGKNFLSSDGQEYPIHCLGTVEVLVGLPIAVDAAIVAGIVERDHDGPAENGLGACCGTW